MNTMRRFLYSFLVLAHLAISASAAEKPAPEKKKEKAPYYLHAFTPNPDGSNETLHLITIRFVPSQKIEVITKWSFEGQMEMRDGKWFADLKTSFNGGQFRGPFEIGKRFETTMMLSSPGIRFCSFVVNRDKDPKEFLAQPFFEIAP